MWLGAAVILLGWTAAAVAAEPKPSQRPPNILWIITDDQRPDSLACYNRAVTGKAESPLGYVESPNWDRFAAEGVLFTHAFCNSPGCAPSRASMHTGQYPHHNGIYGFDRAHNRADICRPTVPQILREQGYLTARFGKLGVRINEWGPGLTWNDPGHYTVNVDMDRDLARNGITDFLKQGIWKKGGVVGTKEHWFFPDGSHVEYYVERTDEPLSDDDLQARRDVEQRLHILRSYTRQLSLLVIGGESPQGSDGTLDAHIEQAFEEFLGSEDAADDKPVFVHLGFHFPHTPVLVPKEWRDRFADKTYRVPEFSKKELERLPPQLVTLYEKMKIDELKPEEKQQAIRDYYAFCAYGDWLLGKAVDRFKEYCRARNEDYLIVIACGDHGWHLGENGYEAKFGPYRMSNQCAVVAISSRGEFPAGTVCDRYVEYVDFAPTFLQAAGMDVHGDDYAYLDGLPLQE
ncbi:MAG: sulfatase, partial [Planctomycetota bacterium]